MDGSVQNGQMNDQLSDQVGAIFTRTNSDMRQWTAVDVEKHRTITTGHIIQHCSADGIPLTPDPIGNFGNPSASNSNSFGCEN